MGRTKVEIGDHVIGVGTAPDNGARINGKRGLVTEVRDYLGDDMLTVEWADGTVNEVEQRNVSGTQQGSFGRQATPDPTAQAPTSKRRWGRGSK